MKIRCIMAADKNWGIGKNGTLPWPHNKADLNWFKKMTMNSYVMMGRKTWDSLPKKPLPDRNNIVISSEINIQKAYENAIWRTDPIKVIEEYKESNSRKDFNIIGGAKLIETCFDKIDEFMISNISNSYDCDVFLPKERIEKEFAICEIGIDYFPGVKYTIWERIKESE